MKAEITYTEAEQLISKYAHKEVKIDFIDEKTIRASLSGKPQDNAEETGILVWFAKLAKDAVNSIKSNIAINLHIVSINGNDITVKYGTDFFSFSIDTIVDRWLEDIPSDIFTPASDNQITIHLDRIDPLKSTLNILTPSDLSFTPTSILLSALLRTY